MALRPIPTQSTPQGFQHALLGKIAFNLITYFEGSRMTFAANYAEHAHILGKPQLQYTGQALDDLRWDLVFHAGFCNPELELLKLRDAVSKHEVLPLVFANGDYKGKFVVTNAEVTTRQTLADGTVISLEANVTLREYAEPKLLGAIKPKAKAIAIKSATKKPAKTVKRKPKPRPINVNICRVGG